MSPAIPRPSSRQIFGSCVVLPEPVSPQTITTWCEAIACAISARLAEIGRSSGNSGRGASARRCWISSGENPIRTRRSSAAEQALGVARERIDFDIDAVAGAKILERRHRERVRNQVDLELGAAHRVYREAHAVYGDRALARDVARERSGGAHA